jgi:hypothetical protein
MNRTAKIIVCWILVLVGAFAFPHIAAGEEKSDLMSDDQCLACHVESDLLPEGFMNEDIHMKRGLSCAGCHGGNPALEDEEKAMSPEEGFIGVPTKNDLTGFCGKCHSDIDFMRRYQPRIPTDQVQQYATSVHGMKLLEGDEKVANCVSCHTSHAIFPAIDARSSVNPLQVPDMCNKCHGDSGYMEEYNIPTDQYEKYAKSVHGAALLEQRDTGSPACNDCHGNHGAVPPGISSIGQVCGSCHFNNMQYFASTKMAQAFENQDLHACEECHNNHAIQETYDGMIGVGEKSVCINCHDSGDKGYAVAGEIERMLQTLTSAYNVSIEKQLEVSRIGMDDVDIGFLLQESHQSLVHARTLVHGFDPELLAPTIEDGEKKADSALVLAIEQVKEHQTRRRGFGMATIFITILLVALFLKIRQMEAG